MNLLTETVEVLSDNGKSPSDVRWVGGSKRQEPFAGTWADFERLANFEYSDGFGGEEVEMTLKVIGDDWWLERHSYDGSEWWEFKTLPSRPANAALMRAADLKED